MSLLTRVVGGDVCDVAVLRQVISARSSKLSRKAQLAASCDGLALVALPSAISKGNTRANEVEICAALMS